MASDLPTPLISADVDLRDFPFMPLDVARLRDSDLMATATAEEFRAAVLLWCASWHQIPSSSIPNDEKTLSQLAGCGRNMRAWRKIAPAALHGFVLCSDGRYYHPLIADKAAEAWEKRLVYKAARESDRDRLARWREAKRAKRNAAETRFAPKGETPLKRVSDGERNAFRNANETSKRGTVEKEKDSPPIIPPSVKRVSPSEAFAGWYAEYPHKIGRRKAEASYHAALARASPEQLAEGRDRYIANKPPGIAWCNPATWLSQDRWLDQPQHINGGNGHDKQSAADNLITGALRAVQATIDRDRFDEDRRTRDKAAASLLERK